MQTLSEKAITQAILQGETFDATLPCGTISISVKEYVPYLCTAIHNGHQMSKALRNICLLNDGERLQEEDPYTGSFIESFPIKIICNQSRYEYDINRSTEHCIYDTAWGKKIWQQSLNQNTIQDCLAKHATYYRLLHVIVSHLEKQFGGCLIIDFHSYNWQIRQYEKPPLFNIGTHFIATERWQNTIDTLQCELEKITLSNIDVQAEYDVIFQGKGYQAEYIHKHFANTLLIPLEIKKVYMDETNGEPFPLILDQLTKGLYLAVLATAAQFNQKLKHSTLNRKDLQTADIEPIVLAVDKALFRLAKGIETLHYVNPINIQNEKRRFFSQRQYIPQFKYRQLRLDPYEFRESLYRLPVSQIQDPLIRSMYRSVIDSYATKIELLTTVGTSQFIYNSLRYYGKPNVKDINNAKFLLHSGNFSLGHEDNEVLDINEAKLIFEKSAEELGLDCKIQISSRLVAKAMVDNARRTLMINRNGKFSRFEINALVQHELGVHMVTTSNSLIQPLRIFALGLPGNTYTQEGLAILSEYLSGNLDLARLKQLSLRVLAVDMMVKGKNFREVFNYLNDEFTLQPEEAFNMVTRVFRGGGFTKDYLYLKGFRDLVKLNKTRNISGLLIGKTDARSLDTIDSLLERGILKKPAFVTPALTNKLYKGHPILDYLVDSIN